VSNKLAEIKAKCERLEAQLAGDFPFAVDDVSWLVAEIERLRAKIREVMETNAVVNASSKGLRAEIERLTAEKAPCENCGRMTEAAGEEIICDRCAAFEEAAKLHEQVTLEGRHEDAMAAVIEYRDLIRAAAKRHAPLQYPDDRSALIEKACSAPDGCISAGQGGAG